MIKCYFFLLVIHSANITVETTMIHYTTLQGRQDNGQSQSLPSRSSYTTCAYNYYSKKFKVP